MPLTRALIQCPHQRLQLLLEGQRSLCVAPSELAPRAFQPGHLGEEPCTCFLFPLPPSPSPALRLPPHFCSPRTWGMSRAPMTAASPGRSPAAPGRSASASSTRPLRVAARSSSGPAQPSTASAPASASASCLWRRRARVWGQWEVCNSEVRGVGGVALPLSPPPWGSLNGGGLKILGIPGGWLTSPEVPTSSDAHGEV